MRLRYHSLTVLLCTLASAFVLTTGISIHAVETALTNRLRSSDREVAHAIAIGLSRQNIAIEDAQSLIDAHFALGNYQRLRLVDSDGKPVYVRERQHPPGETGVADTRLFWLWTLRPREQLMPAVAPVKTNTLGVSHVSVQSLLSFDHHSSERWLIQLMGIFGALGLIASATLVWLSARRNRSLVVLESALERMLESDSVRLDTPGSPEFKPVFDAANRVAELINQRNLRAMAQVEQLNRMRRTDPATGLLNRDAFLAWFEQAGQALLPGELGHLFMLRLLDLPQLNIEKGRTLVDEMLRDLARSLETIKDITDGGVCARLSGSELVLVGGPDETQAATIRSALDRLVQDIPAQTSTMEIRFGRDERCADVLRRLEQNVPTGEESAGPTADLRADWYEKLSLSLAQHHFFLQGFPLVNANRQSIHREYYLRLPERKTGIVHTGGTLMAWSEHLGLAAEVDIEVVKLALTEAAQREEGRVCINLTAASLIDENRRNSLVEELQQSPRYAGRIDIDVNESIAFSHLDLLTQLISRLRPLGVQVGIDRLDEHAGTLMRLQGSGIRYLKVAAGLTADLLDPQVGRERSRLLTGILHAARDLSVDLYAENVISGRLLSALHELGFAGVSGPAANT